MEKVVNKWTGKLYTVINETDREVTLEREDRTRFTIQKSELLFSYYEKTYKKVSKNT